MRTWFLRLMFGAALGASVGCGGSEGSEPGGDSGGAALGELECRNGADCDNSTCNRVSDAVCYEVRDAAGCGSDEDCAGTDGADGGGGAGGGGGGPPVICDLPHFTCTPSWQPRPACVRGCETDADCPSTLACAPDHRCRATSCAADADCPKNHVCDTIGGACARTACSSDAECEGFCVLGRCEEKPGMCFLY
ncbi:hypothetical protein WME90_34300 [Sorangium sp. So ce375]|uniref:hypothetical protein n=1 Tax=Sorangium sp. So ce375 TaxID=3133306 RepID=UPI003F5C0F97